MKARLNTWWIVMAAISQGMLPVSVNNDAVANPRNVETIVYTTLRPPNWDIFLFDESAASPRRLTNHPAPDYDAVFSPDGEWVVFKLPGTGNANLSHSSSRPAIYINSLTTRAWTTRLHSRWTEDRWPL